MTTNHAIHETSPTRQSASGAPLIGNRLALAGAVLYLLEWVAIVGAGGLDVLFAPGTNSTTVLDGYLGNANTFAWASGWFGVVLLGRVLFAVAVRAGLRVSGRDHPMAEFGVLAMTVGVVFEVVAYGLVAGTAALADHGGTPDIVTALDRAASSVDELLWGATGVAVVSLAWAMLRSQLFSRALCALGLLSGTLLVASGLLNAPSLDGILELLRAAAPMVWIWMVWTGAVMWRHRAR